LALIEHAKLVRKYQFATKHIKKIAKVVFFIFIVAFSHFFNKIIANFWYFYVFSRVLKLLITAHIPTA
jgi:hypothetical protein